jgi:hypothetical protein
MADPKKIMMVGDLHGNTGWARTLIGRAPELLHDEPFRLLLQLGDFGIWPGRIDYIPELSKALDRAGAIMWFLDGNHEDFPKLARLRALSGAADDELAPVDPDRRIWHVPRGYRWNWNHLDWLAVGSGVSLDRARRAEGASWWPQEEITAEETQRIRAGRQVDVMVSHDVPTSVMTVLRPQLPEAPGWWEERDFIRSGANQARLQLILDAAMPDHLFHGHLHHAHRYTMRAAYGKVAVRGLDADGDDANWGLLDTVGMEWIPVSPTPRETKPRVRAPQ